MYNVLSDAGCFIMYLTWKSLFSVDLVLFSCVCVCVSCDSMSFEGHSKIVHPCNYLIEV